MEMARKKKSENYRDVLEYIILYKGYNFIAPSRREIMRACGYKSTACVQYALRDLERRGKIRLTGNKTRNIEVVGEKWTYRVDRHGIRIEVPEYMFHSHT